MTVFERLVLRALHLVIQAIIYRGDWGTSDTRQQQAKALLDDLDEWLPEK